MLIIIIVVIIYDFFLFLFNSSYLGVLRDGNPLQDYKFLNKGWIKVDDDHLYVRSLRRLCKGCINEPTFDGEIHSFGIVLF